jgi:prepilin-type N-terminal cleavage/methylation domain-containing protein
MSGKQGFTLVEVLVASVILVAGMVAVLRGFSVAVDAIDSSREVLEVSDFFDNKLAELEIATWPQRDPPVADSGVWESSMGSIAWRFHSNPVTIASNATLHRLYLEAIPMGRVTQYGIATEWLSVRRTK